MNFLKTFSVFLCMMLSVMTARAQLLQIITNDTTGINGGMIMVKGNGETISFTNGKYVFNSTRVNEITDVAILLGQNFYQAILQPGEKLYMQVKNKNGKLSVTFKGTNADAIEFLKQQQQLIASGWETRELDENLEELNIPVKDFDFQKELSRVMKMYPIIKAAAAKVTNHLLRERFLHETDVLYVKSRIDIVEAREKNAGRDFRQCAQFKQVIDEIDPNDSVAYGLGLSAEYILSKICTTKYDIDQTAYALDFANAVDKFISNPKIRHNLFSELADAMFNSDFVEQSFELDRFWNSYVKLADQSLIDYYQQIVDSRHATIKGKICPDEQFEDPQGNKHMLSEFFNKGKFTYIDIWATWCGPCCAEIPFIEKHVENYKNNPKIQFISISIDNNHNAWRKKIEKDNPQWQQFISSTKADNEKLSKDWGITGIPRFVLVCPDGTIYNATCFRPSDPKFRELINEIIK